MTVTKCNVRGARCALMDRVLHRTAESSVSAGIMEESMLNLKTGNFTAGIVVHRTPGHRRGKDREQPFFAVLGFCPFCGERIMKIDRKAGTRG